MSQQNGFFVITSYIETVYCTAVTLIIIITIISIIIIIISPLDLMLLSLQAAFMQAVRTVFSCDAVKSLPNL